MKLPLLKQDSFLQKFAQKRNRYIVLGQREYNENCWASKSYYILYQTKVL